MKKQKIEKKTIKKKAKRQKIEKKTIKKKAKKK